MKKLQNTKQYMEENNISTLTLLCLFILCLPLLILEFSYKLFKLPVIIVSALLSIIFTSYFVYKLSLLYIYLFEYMYFIAQSFLINSY